MPLLRIPALVFPGDAALRLVDDQMLLGDMLLVKPVTWPMYYLPESAPITPVNTQGIVHLPSEHSWYEADTGRCWQGGQQITISAPMDTIPVFVRSGSILPLGIAMQHSGESSAAPLEIIVYPGEDGDFTLYDDAGDDSFVCGDKETPQNILRYSEGGNDQPLGSVL